MSNHLIPARALERAPEPVKDAQAKAAEAIEAAHQAKLQARKAREAVRAANALDAEARAEAARKGAKKLPAPSKPDRIAEAEAAKATADLLADQERAAIAALNDAVRGHQRELVEIQAKAIESVRAEVEDRLSDLSDALDVLASEDAVLLAYRRADAGPSRSRTGVDGPLSFAKPRRLEGADERTIRRQRPALLAALREVADQYATAETETVGDRVEREKREAEASAQRRRAQATLAHGVYVR